MRTVALSEDDFALLLVMCGYATASAVDRKDKRLAGQFIRLVNEINKDNPNYRPYAIPASWGGLP